MPQPSFSFHKENRLRLKSVFTRIFRSGQFFRARHLYMALDQEKSEVWQFGVVARKKDYHSAVARNRVKRRLRELIRLSQSQVRPCRAVVVAKRGVDQAPWPVLQREWEQVCRMAHLWGTTDTETKISVTAPPSQSLREETVLIENTVADISTSCSGVRLWPRRLLCAPIRFYRLCISPLFPPVCRFTPTCSQYALEAVTRYGVLKGAWLSLRRLMRCHPWHKGGYDPVP